MTTGRPPGALTAGEPGTPADLDADRAEGPATDEEERELLPPAEHGRP